MKVGITSTKHLASMSFRIDPSLHLSEGLRVREELTGTPYALLTINDVSEKVFLGNIFSRVFVKDKGHGMTYLAASDTVLSNIETGRFLSKNQANKLKHLWLKKDWILVTCSGTLGNVTYTNSTFEDKIATHDLIRIVPSNNLILKGVVYAFLASKYGYYQITQSQFGGVVKHINDKELGNIVIPQFPEDFQKNVNKLVYNANRLREDATIILTKANRLLRKYTNLRELTPEDYDYYGSHSANREVSCYIRNIKDIGSLTINAFNHSERIRRLKQSIACKTIPLYDLLNGNQTFSTGSFPRVEVQSHNGVMLINQSDIFNTSIKGKYISKRHVNTKNLVEYGEVLIAGVGTLGESESFCRVVFANEDLEGQLISGEFIRMKTNERVPSGYLYTWLDCDYGFRLIRNLQAGTKLCRPIPKLLLEIPVPIIDIDKMNEIHNYVIEAHTKRHQANIYEKQAISMVEQEIGKWSNN